MADAGWLVILVFDHDKTLLGALADAREGRLTYGFYRVNLDSDPDISDMSRRSLSPAGGGRSGAKKRGAPAGGAPLRGQRRPVR